MSLRILVLLLYGLSLVGCANQAALTGGEIDKEGPELLLSEPLHNSLNFKDKRVEILFDEFVQVRNTSEILISPYVDGKIKYSATGKKLLIEFDGDVVLRDSATYEIFFGESVVDLNEGNPKKDFSYRFSTYDVLDSLKLVGAVVDGYTDEKVKNAIIAMYEVEIGGLRDFDSIKPAYVARATESGVFEIKNVKQGAYWVKAFKDDNRDYLIQPNELFGFVSQTIQMDTLVDTVLIKLTNDRSVMATYTVDLTTYKAPMVIASKPMEKNLYFTDLNNVRIPGFFGFDRDTFYLSDSLSSEFLLLRGAVDALDTIRIVKKKKKVVETKKIGVSVWSQKHLSDEFFLRTGNVTDSVVPSKFLLMTQDSVDVAIRDLKVLYNGVVKVSFERPVDGKNLILSLDSGAIWGVGNTNQSSSVTIGLDDSLEFGMIEFIVDSLGNLPISGLICSLIDKDGKVIRTKRTDEQKFIFKHLNEGTYTLKVVIDKNANGVWDSNDLRNMEQQEPILNFGPYQLQKGWDLLENAIKLPI